MSSGAPDNAVPEAELRHFTQLAERAALAAGGVIQRFARLGVETEYKADGSEVTAADRAAEETIRAIIASALPDHAVVGEEFGAEGNAEFTWYIDPIDGTKSFVHGIPLYTTLVALLRGEEALCGVICNPSSGELMSAFRGGGCWLNGKQTFVRSCQRISDALVLTTDPGKLLRDLGEGAGEILQQARMVRTWADGYGYMMLASGRADVMLDPEMSAWDAGPLQICVEEAKGIITTTDGRRTALLDSAVAANLTLHPLLMEALDTAD